MSGEECEALGLLAEQACREVAVSETYLAVVGDRTGDAECLQSLAYRLGGLGCGLHAFLDSDCGAYDIGPLRVLEADLLGVLAHLVGVDALLGADCLGLVDVLDAVFVESGVDLINPALVTFKKCHIRLLLFTGVNIFNCVVEAAVGAFRLLDGLGAGRACLESVHQLAEVHELVTDHLVVGVEGHAGAVAFGHLEVA